MTCTITSCRFHECPLAISRAFHTEGFKACGLGVFAPRARRCCEHDDRNYPEAMIMVSVMSVRLRTSRILMLTAFMSSSAAWTRPGSGDEWCCGRRHSRSTGTGTSRSHWQRLEASLQKFSVRAEHNTGFEDYPAHRVRNQIPRVTPASMSWRSSVEEISSWVGT